MVPAWWGVPRGTISGSCGRAYPGTIADLPTQRLFGLPFVSDGSIDDVAEALLGAPTGSGWRCVVTPNVDHVVRYARVELEAQVARDATVVLPDGMPIVWSSRLLGRPLRSRLAGSDLFSALWPRLGAAGTPTVVVASSDEVLAGLRAEHPTVRGIVPPFFATDDAAAVEAVVDDVVAACDEVSASFLFVLVSMPKHHLLAHHLRRRWADRPGPVPVVLLLGASGEFHLGLIARAPAWMQRFGLEWLHRLLGDPRRMARRYLVEDPRFVGLLWQEWRAGRRGQP